MSRFVDSVITYRILQLLTTPFENTDAYRLGIIDNKGKELKSMRDLNTVQEKDAYTLLHRLVFRLKKIVERVPIENKKLASFAAALSLIKEQFEQEHEPIDLEHKFISRINQVTEEEILCTQRLLEHKYLLPFKIFAEEAPANNAQATPGIDSFIPGAVGSRQNVLLRRKKGKNVSYNSNAFSKNK